MRVFQATYRDRDGERQTAAKWYIEFTDHREKVRRIPGLSDRRLTEALGRRIDDLVGLKAAAQTLTPEMSRWIEGLPGRLQKNLARIGLLDGGRVAAMRPLIEHLDGAADAPGWKQYLIAKGNGAEHISTITARARAVITGCKFAFWSDISASRVMAYLDDLRADKQDEEDNSKAGISAQTFNFYLAAMKGFCRWMVKDGRATESPVAHLQGLNVKIDRRHDRRALSVEELRWLLDTTRNGPTRFGMTGPARALLYKLAVETGLRRAELASLTRASFHLDGDKPTVTVSAGYSKHRREDCLPLRADTAAELRDFLAVKMPDAIVFTMPKTRQAGMFHADRNDARAAWLEDAKTPQERKAREDTRFLCYTDAAGRYADFHALRHSCGSLLAAAGVHPKVAQAVMRHCTIDLTMSRYSHVFAGQEADAVAALPDLGESPVKGSAKMTGTYDGRAALDAPQAAQRLPRCPKTNDHSRGGLSHPANVPEKADSVLADCLAQTGSFSCNPSRPVATNIKNTECDKRVEFPKKTAKIQARMMPGGDRRPGGAPGLQNQRGAQQSPG